MEESAAQLVGLSYSVDQISDLLRFYWNTRQPVNEKRKTSDVDNIQNSCKELWERDYRIASSKEIPSVLCSSYPKHIYVPVNKLNCGACKQIKTQEEVQSEEIFEVFCESSNGRARGRFIAPVILVCLPQGNESQELPHTRYIFRSGALIQPPEAFLRSMKGTEKVSDIEKDKSMKSIRIHDRDAMIKLGVGFVFDLMVEKQLNKFFGFLKCVSSEKSPEHGDLYSRFDILSAPFPGYELFSRFNEFCRSEHKKSETTDTTHHGHYPSAFETVTYPWKKKCSTELNAADYFTQNPSHAAEKLQEIIWHDYQTWSIVELTQTYFLVIMSLLYSPIRDEDKKISEAERILPAGTGGILIHCISGWDRTPLFVSLIRLSLWADEAVHQNLSATEIIYFTIAYDWLLFGHDLHTRAGQSVELLYFCFIMLEHISNSKFSLFPNSEGETRASRLSLLHDTFAPIYLSVCSMK